MFAIKYFTIIVKIFFSKLQKICIENNCYFEKQLANVTNKLYAQFTLQCYSNSIIF